MVLDNLTWGVLDGLNIIWYIERAIGWSVSICNRVRMLGDRSYNKNHANVWKR